ncbi:MAG: hypothetical protein HFG45_06130 [Oscillospiraceae bacterium]|jgi:hypothetical protein|nr:hypothetical protein [Oscillospiraceae bacterium]
MPREKEGFRDQYAALKERFPEREAITLDELESILPLDRRVLINDPDFPTKKMGKKYVVSLVMLARWMC